jgi:hypothetical protein
MSKVIQICKLYLSLFQHTDRRRELIVEEELYNEKRSDRNTILVWLGLLALFVPSYGIYAICGSRSHWRRSEDSPIPVIYVPTYR